MAKPKRQLRVRMYRIGFGDFFLLTVPTAAGPRHILIDCGVHAGDLGSIDAAVADLARETDKHLSLVIVTHRHADHISGFATCADRFAEFKVDRIWMSWWDDPHHPQAQAFQQSLTAMANRLQLQLAARTDAESDELREMALNITGGGLLGVAGGSNDKALRLLRERGFRESPLPDYYKAGDRPTLPPELAKAGLEATILGPPISQSLIKQMSRATEEYLALADDDSAGTRLVPFAPHLRTKAWDVPARAVYPGTLDDLVRGVKDVQPDLLAARAKQADNTINNQSLVVLFEMGGRSLLFVGDAQWGNWENFLYGEAVGNGDHDLLEKSKTILSELDFYKVGHHGSTNATPISALEAMRKGCVAMCSTEPGCYGKAKKGTEVPRGPLLKALGEKTNGQVACSDQVEVKGKAATKGRPALAKVFSTPGDLYIDYHLEL